MYAKIQFFTVFPMINIRVWLCYISTIPEVYDSLYVDCRLSLVVVGNSRLSLVISVDDGVLGDVVLDKQFEATEKRTLEQYCLCSETKVI